MTRASDKASVLGGIGDVEMTKHETKSLEDRIDLVVGSIDILDDPHGRLADPDTSHCIAEIGEAGSGGFDFGPSGVALTSCGSD